MRKNNTWIYCRPLFKKISLYLSQVCIICLASLLMATTNPFSICAQSTPYFQQEVDYRIKVTLDDQAHALIGDIAIKYTNRSPEVLRQIYMHLWPNAYKNQKTAFARQMARTGQLDFYFAREEELGFIDQLQFKVDGEEIKWIYDQENPDIAILNLNEPLQSGATLTISTPFFVQIPKSFSRLGHVGESYQVTQWYPKPAVFDRKGWHPMPYLNQGEYYSEFGSFDVEITLPANYVVAATGVLQNADEITWLQSLAEKPIIRDAEENYFPPSSAETKTLKFLAENVHDFAWFADKRFQVRKSAVQLSTGKVDTWVMFTGDQLDFWENAITYVDRSVRFYSDQVGPYPYPHATAIQSRGSRGVDMEYPMVTIIGPAYDEQWFDQVIAHEVGHNWFYGILGFNERDHPWLDEGLNSYYEYRYANAYYDTVKTEFAPSFISRRTPLSDLQFYYSALADRNLLQPPNTTSDQLTPGNYYTGAYERPALALNFLEQYLGTEKFDEAMQSFYEDWKFRHPYPEDLRASLEASCSCDLDWFFFGLMGSGKMVDYGITGVANNTLTVENYGTINAPVQIIGKNGNVQQYDFWIEGFSGTQSIDLPGGEATEIQLYQPQYSTDVTWGNNVAKSKSPGKPVNPLSLKFLGAYGDKLDKTQFFLPFAGWNNYDKFMLGATLYNSFFPPKNFQYLISPAYGFASGEMVGYGNVRWSLFPESDWLQRFQADLEVKSYHYNKNYTYGFRDRYLKIAPGFRLDLRKQTPTAPGKLALRYRYIYLRQDYGQGRDIENLIFTEESRSYYVNELLFERDYQRSVNESTLVAGLHQGKGFFKLFADYDHRIRLRKPGKFVHLHGFAGWMPHFDNPDANVSFLISGISSTGFSAKDYNHDEILFGRNEKSGILSQQLFMKDAQLKTLSNVGQSEEWMVAIGAEVPLPFPAPVYIYGDLAFHPAVFDDGVELTVSTGLSLALAKDVVEVYFPFWESQDIRDGVVYQNQRDTFWKRVSFLFNLNKIHPFDLQDAVLDAY